MKRVGNEKFPNSVQLFKFCQKVLCHKRGTKVRDQEVGAILNFNPSDCSHWKRGEKNVRSVFALAKLADALQVESNLIHDVASGAINLDEAFFEYNESIRYQSVISGEAHDFSKAGEVYDRILPFVDQLHRECEFVTPPLYLPEVMRSFSFVITQPTEMLDKLSRILRVKMGKYCIQFKKGEIRPQTRVSMVNDLAKILFQGERKRYPELGEGDKSVYSLEEILFTANLLIPKKMLLDEMSKLDVRRNMVSELADFFWVPKSLICFQMQEIVRGSISAKVSQRPAQGSGRIDEGRVNSI